MPQAMPTPLAPDRTALALTNAAPVDRLLARAEAGEHGWAEGFAGHLPPDEAWALLRDGVATLVDVRSSAELRFVGRVPGAVHVPWADGLDLVPNPRFVDDLLVAVGGRLDRPVLMLCRSGVRSIKAAQAATAAGFDAAFNVLEGFEGAIDERRQRGHRDGWRRRGLPWEQG
jgi:rhodanese-related sulfurtransferase